MNAMPRAPSGEPVRVLLVDDDSALHRLLADLLDSRPTIRFVIDRAKAFEEALDRARHGRVDVCLLDVGQTGRKGLEFLEALAAQGLMLPTIVLADERSATLDREAMALGAVAFIDRDRLDAPGLERTIRYGMHQQDRARRLARGVLEDQATGLISQTLYRDRLNRAIAFAERHRRQVAVIIVDLAIAKGREQPVLTEAGRCLTRALRVTDTVARLADRRLALLVEGVRRSDHVALVVRKVQRLLTDLVEAEPGDHAGRPSIGVAIYPSEGLNGETLMRRADMALRRAMADGGSRFRFASERVDLEANESMIMEKAFREAVRRRELRFRFHPEMHLKEQATSLAGEVFWFHPDRQWLSISTVRKHVEIEPPIAEIMDWMLAAAAERLSAWDGLGLAEARLSITCPFGQPSVIPILAQAVTEQIHPRGGHLAGRLDIALPERLILAGNEASCRDIGKLRATGVRLSLESFGGGEAGIQDLRLDLLDGLKLAHGLHRDLPGDRRREALLRAVIGLGHELDLRVTAKCARDQRQFSLLKDLGCDVIQLRGAFPPVSADVATNWLLAPRARKSAPDGGGPHAATLPEVIATAPGEHREVQRGNPPPVRSD